MSVAPWRTQWWKSRLQPFAERESWTVTDDQLNEVDGFRILQELLDDAAPPNDPLSWARTMVYLPVLDALPMLDAHPPLPEGVRGLNAAETRVLRARIQALLWTKFFHPGLKA